jgi:hypothetical protein
MPSAENQRNTRPTGHPLSGYGNIRKSNIGLASDKMKPDRSRLPQRSTIRTENAHSFDIPSQPLRKLPSVPPSFPLSYERCGTSGISERLPRLLSLGRNHFSYRGVRYLHTGRMLSGRTEVSSFHLNQANLRGAEAFFYEAWSLLIQLSRRRRPGVTSGS